MVESTQTVEAAEAIRSLLAAGLGEREVHELVTAVFTETRPAEDQPVNGTKLKVYEVLPDGLIDLQEASRKYHLHRSTLHNWIRAGHLPVVARKKAPATGGGYLAVREADVVRLKDNRPRRGRPRKK